MAEARCRHDAQQTATLMAHLANLHCDLDGRDPYTADDFLAGDEDDEPKEEPKIKVPLKSFKGLFVRT
jgi:hypothetical protein